MNRILALDYGTHRVGVAISDPLGIIATALPFLSIQPSKKEFSQKFQQLLKEYNDVTQILVGMPRNMDGSYGESAKQAQAFIELLKSLTSIPIKTIDERLSTVQASRLLHEAGLDSRKQKDKIDSASARVLLQQFLDSNPSEI